MKALRIILITSLIFISTVNAQIGGYALKFDGVDDYLSTTYNTQLNIFTIECWVKGNAAPGSVDATGVVHKDLNFNITWDHGDAAFRGAAAVRVSNNWYPASFGSLSGGYWYHLAMTYDGENLRAYKNGKLITTNSDPSGQPDTDINPLTIGKHNNYSAYFGGMIDEVRIWDVVKTEAEITANMYKEIGTNSNLKVYYKMNDGSGAVTMDNSANGYTGTFQGAPLWKASGALGGPGNTLTFTSSSSTKVTTPTSLSDAMSGSPVLTVAGWVNPSSLADWQVIYSRVTGVDYTKRVIIQASGSGLGGNDEFYISVANGTSYGAYTQANILQAGVWTHFALVFDGSQPDDATRLKFYVNGVLQTLTFTGSSGQVPTNVHTGSESATIGSENNIAYFSGYIDELSFWTSARTQSQVRNMMCRSLSGDETGLQAYYRFDASSGTTAYDHSLSGRHGTLVNLTFDANAVTSYAFNTWIGSESSAWMTYSNWRNGIPPTDAYNAGIYKWPGGNDINISSAVGEGAFGVKTMLIATGTTPTLSSNLSVGGTLVVESPLDLNGKTINLGSTGYLAEGTGYLYGTSGSITANRTLSNVNALNVAGLGAVISTTANMGLTTISRGHSSNIQHGTGAVKRWYNITPTTNSGLNATLVFNYLTSELGTVTESKLALFRSTDGTTWTKMNGTLDPDNNKLTLSGIDAFSYWTAADNDNPLPVELANFTSSVSGKTVTLNWETKTEVMNHGFEVERRTPETDWQKIGFIEGYGTSNSPKYYSFSDQPNATGKTLYRLKQIDTDGGFEYSPEILVEMGLPAEFALHQNYPNPFNPETVIGYALPVAGGVKLEVYNSLGEKITTLVDGMMEAGDHEVKFHAGKLPSGLYFYKIYVTGVKNFTSVKKFVLVK